MKNHNTQLMLEFISNNPGLSSKAIYDDLDLTVSYATLKRLLTQLRSENLVEAVGKGKGTTYKVAECYELFQPIDIETYFKREADERTIKENFNFTLINSILESVSLFTEAELLHLDDLQKQYIKNISGLSETEYSRGLELFAIDLSWKSSQIEGNTYSLLETERLLKEKETADGRTKDEAVMLLNHKDALDIIIDNPGYISPLTIAKIENIHGLLIKDLGVERNIRIRRVGISGTNYRPLDNEFQIKEALESMCELVNAKSNIFEKALLALILTSYIQAFNDGNKRTARILSNAILMSNQYCPISFRTVNSIYYKKAMLLFYEQNNITAFKGIFMEQFEFSVKTYF